MSVIDEQFKLSVPDWALHCTENPEITVQYLSDSGSVQLSRQCKDSLKEISCQGKMTQMAMYDELKCSDELSTTPEPAVDEVPAAENVQPEVIIKNPEKMLEDVFSSDLEVDLNVLDVKTRMDLMLNDQPDVTSDQESEQKPKTGEKKQLYQKKKYVKKETMKGEEAEMMMGDAPAQGKEESSTKLDGLSTDRERRDASETTTPSAEEKFSTTDESSTVSAPEESSSLPTDTTTEVAVTTTTEETSTKNIVQGHPLFHNHAVFKEPISIDNINSTMERKDVSNNEDHFIPPMLLVKARFNAPKPVEELVDEAKEVTSDMSSTAFPTDSVSDSSKEEKNLSQNTTEEVDAVTDETSASSAPEVTQSSTSLPADPSEKPILVEKRNDPRLGLMQVVATTQATTLTSTEDSKLSTESLPTSTAGTTESSTTLVEGLSSVSSSDVSFSDSSSTTEAQTDAKEMFESSTTDGPASSSHSDASVVESITEKAPLLSSIHPTLEALKVLKTSPSPAAKKVTQMRNDIDEPESQENSEEISDHSRHESNLNNEDNYQPYKPNRHRSIMNEHHHGPGFSIGKILG